MKKERYITWNKENDSKLWVMFMIEGMSVAECAMYYKVCQDNIWTQIKRITKEKHTDQIYEYIDKYRKLPSIDEESYGQLKLIYTAFKGDSPYRNLTVGDMRFPENKTIMSSI